MDKELEQFIEENRFDARAIVAAMEDFQNINVIIVSDLESFLPAYLAERDKRVIDYLKQCFKEDHHLSQMLTVGDIDDKLDVYAANLKNVN